MGKAVRVCGAKFIDVQIKFLFSQSDGCLKLAARGGNEADMIVTFKRLLDIHMDMEGHRHFEADEIGISWHYVWTWTLWAEALFLCCIVWYSN